MLWAVKERHAQRRGRPSICPGKWLRNNTTRLSGFPGLRRRAAPLAAENLWYTKMVSEHHKHGTDRILRALIEDGRARIVVTTATQAVDEMVTRHRTLGIPAVALGRAAMAGLLLATLTKDDEQVTMQVLGNGPLGSLIVDARSSGRVRGFVKRPQAATWEPSMASAPRLDIGKDIGRQGVLGVVRDLGLAQNYSGQIAIQSGEIDEEVERYLNISEQVDSIVRCDVLVDKHGRVAAAAGLLVQTLPQAHGAALLEFLRDALPRPMFSAVLRERLAKGQVEPESIAKAALGQCADGIQVLEERDVTFFCPCTRERAEATLGMLRPEDLNEMILETNEAEVTCNFCGIQYRFDEADLEKIRRKQGKSVSDEPPN
jgi:molecular chaperone Hsp33